VNDANTKKGGPLTFVDSCVTDRKKESREGLPGELKCCEECICHDAYRAAEKDGGVCRELMMSRGEIAILVRPCTGATGCGGA
jgi:hypothetical protein